MMNEYTRPISLRQVALINFSLKLNRWVNRLALCACAAIVLYVVGYSVYEWLVPPTPVVYAGPLGAGGGYRSPALVEPAFRWLGYLLFLPANTQIITGLLLLLCGKPSVKRIVAGLAVLLLAWAFWLVGTLPCSCAPPLD